MLTAILYLLQRNEKISRKNDCMEEEGQKVVGLTGAGI